MDKVIQLAGKSEKGVFTYVIDTESPFLIKTAGEYHPEIASYINSAKKISGKTQVLLTALGAGEYWGNNVNGDYFPEKALANPTNDFGYKTFLNAKVYKHHVNKDPKGAYGDVVVSVYNPIYHRVELIIILDDSKARDIVDKINDGDYPSWSMGCRVPYDVCSICGNRARTRAEYCDHLKYFMGRLDPVTGKMVYAINYTPKFFDISYVFIGADKIAKTLKKVASVGVQFKEAEIKKEIPADEPPASLDNIEDDIEELKEQEPLLPKEILNNVARRHSLPEILSTLAALRFVPKPQEFQRIVLVSTGRDRLADQLEDEGLCFSPDDAPGFSESDRRVVNIDPYHFNPRVMDSFSPFVEQRSFAPPHFVRRVTILIKKASRREDDEPSLAKKLTVAALIAGLYRAVMNDASKNMSAKVLPAVLAKNPGLTALLGFGAMAMPLFASHRPRGVVDRDVITNYVPDMQPEFTRGSDLHERNMKNPITKMGSKALVGMGMTFGSLPLANMASGYLQKKRMTDPEYREGRIKNFIRRYPELAAVATSAAGIGLLAGRPIPNKIYDLAAKGSKTALDAINKAIPALKKQGTVSDFVVDSLVWPMAMGGKNLPHKIVGGMLDQAAFKGVERLSKKSTKAKIDTKN